MSGNDERVLAKMHPVVELEHRGRLRRRLLFFYPRMDTVVVNTWVNLFSRYWNKEIDFQGLVGRGTLPAGELRLNFHTILFEEDK